MKKIIFDRYEITSSGFIYDLQTSLPVKIYQKNNSLCVRLYSFGYRRTFTLSKLILQTFHDDYDDKIHKINFKDNNRLNCSLDNLILNNTSYVVPGGIKITIHEYYELNSNGHIFSLKSNKYLDGHLDKDGFLVVHLQLSEYKKKKYYLHKLILQSFDENYNENTDSIGFKDGNKSNCSLENLVLIKNGSIKLLPNEKMNIFFEKQEPYKIASNFIGYCYNTGKDFLISNSFTSDDLLQHFVLIIWRRLPSYFAKHSHIDFGKYAFSVLKHYITNKEFWKYYSSLQNVVKVNFESFDMFDGYLNGGSFISLIEAKKTNYSGFTYDRS